MFHKRSIPAVGDGCENKSECVKISNCKSAIESVKKYRWHGLTRCGFEGRREIVCCKKADIINRDYLNEIDSPSVLMKSFDMPNPTKAEEARERYLKSLKRVDPDVTEDRILNGQDVLLGEFSHMVFFKIRTSY